MDKNKSRTDLLAAGRKKLQQYRQKKDNKGNNSKSSGKGSKSSRDTQQHAVDGERSKDDAEKRVAISESNDKVDSVETDSAAASDKYSAKAAVSEFTPHAAVSGFPSGDPGVDQTKLNQSGNDECDVDSGLSMDDGSSTFVFEDAKDSIESSDPTNPIEKSLDLGTTMPTDLSSDQKGGGEQVTDVGAMQDVGGSSDNQIAKGKLKQFEGDGNLPSSGFNGTSGNNAIADSGTSSNKEDFDVAAQSIYTDNIEQSLGCKKVDLSSVLDGSMIKLSQLAEILQVLDEDEFRFLILSKESSPEKFRDADEMKVHVSFVHEAFERLKEQLHVPSFSKDAMHLQLCEQQKLVDKICTFNASPIEVHGKDEKFAEEIMKCRNELHEVVLERDELQKQLHISKDDVEDLAAKVNEMQNKLEMAQAEISTLSSELLSCQKLVKSLQIENENLNGSLKVMAEEREILSEGRKRLEEEEKTLREYEKQSRELEELKSSGAGLQAECSKALVNLKEAKVRIDQLTKENDALNSDLEFYKGKLNELNESRSQFATVESRDVESDVDSLTKGKADWSSLEQLKGNVYDDASGFFALKRNLGSAEMVMRKLENEIESLHMHKVSSKVSSPKVSRLIQAFETKHHVDEQDAEKPSSSENQTTEDLYMRTKMVTGNLRLLLEELVNDAENASEFCRVMQIKLGTDAANLGRTKYASLRKHTDCVEEANLELMVLYEVMRSHCCDAVAKENGLLNLCNALQKQELILKSENSQLREKLKEFDTKISELHRQLDGLHEESDEKVASISNKLQTLQAEVAERESILEEEWKSAFAQVLHTVGELDSTIETRANLPATGGNSADIIGCVAASVRGACKMIEDLRGQVEAAHSDRQEILERSDLALNTLHSLYNEISELVITFGHHQDKADSVQDVLHADVFSALLYQLKELLGERLQLESKNQQLNADLMTRSREIDALDKRCLKSEAIIKLVEEIEHSDILEVTTTDIDEPVARLESLILLLIQKYKEVDQSLGSSKSLEMQLSGSQGQVEQLQIVLVQYENENLVLKQSLKTAEEDVIALNTKLKEKVTELEQSEQRVLSLREKLSIAVSKGKGLISQRDSLKQSLAETSKELEKCSQELLSKDGRLHELESKLSVYSEAGERMEALESELSYIRNSATALRESFLLKDSVLQRIEEILEDIELPEHFHSRNTIEKVEWLAKSVGGNSLPLGDWEQRSSVGGGLYSDAGFVGVDGLKDDMQPNHDSGDDFRRRYEELENKFYGLAEQNEMLEQSLMDMNNLVQRWEGILNRLDMPSQLQSMEPEDKIQWFETALSETQNHCYSLQQKIDYLENFCGSLVAGVEDSQKRASKIVEAFQLACVEKEVISLGLEIQSHENEEISKKYANLEIRNGNLQHEVSILQEEKLQVDKDSHHTNDAIRRLQELLCDALQDSCTVDTTLSQNGVRYVEEMLSTLIEKHNTLLSGKPVNIDPINVHANEKGQMSHPSREFDEQDVVTLRKKLEDSKAEAMILKEERDGYMLKNQSLLHEVEELEMRKNELHELLNQEELKSASLTETLSKKLEDSVSGLKILQEEKDKYEMSNQSLLSEIEAVGMKKKELQELLNQEELRSASLRDTLNKKLEDCMRELAVLKEEKNTYVISNQSLLHEAQELEMKNKDLQELLHQEELRSASLKELLHQAELKSDSLQELLNQDELKSVSLRDTLSKELKDCMSELTVLKEEKDRYVVSSQALLQDVEELRMEKKKLQELLDQEELSSANLRESLNKKVQDSISELMILKEEKERLVLSNQSLLHEVKELKMSRKELQELLNQEELKSGSLAETLKNVQDSMSELMILQDEKDRLAQDNQSLLLAVEELEMKKKELQELLDQEEMKSSSLVETLKNLQDSDKELVLLKDERDRVVQDNQSLLCAVEELEMKKKELHELLNQEEMKSTSLSETLQDSANELVILKDEKDRVVQDNQSLLRAVEELEMKKKELQELLDQEEMKSASLVETLKNLQDSASELVILKDEKDRVVQDNQSLIRAVEELEMKKKELQELLDQEGMKSASLAESLKNLQDSANELVVLKDEKDMVVQDNQSLLRTVEELKMKRKELQELLDQEEMKSASLAETLKNLQDSATELEILKDEKDMVVQDNQSLLRAVEELEMKKKELQELLDQEEMKSTSLGATLKNLQDSVNELVVLKDEKDRVVQDNQSLLRAVEELKIKKKELQELLDQEEMKSASLAETLKNVQDSASELFILKDEKDRVVQDNQSLLRAVEELEMKKKELQELRNQEEQKSNALREKLNVAVRKGKSLVQQRDGMKQVIEELSAELERLKSETNNTARAISEYEVQTNNLLTAQERLQVMESEKAILRNHLEETERLLQEKDDRWNRIVNALENIDLGYEFDSRDPDVKMKEVGKYLTDLRTQMDSLDQESRKSKRAAELLLAELNEVQERNDILQDEVAKADHELSELSRERDFAEKTKREAFAQIEKLSREHSEEKDRQLSEIMFLRSGVDSMREDLSAIERELGDVLSKDFELLRNLKAVLKSLLESGGIPKFDALFPSRLSHGVKSRKSENKVFMTEIDSLRELFSNHSRLLQEEASQLSEVMMNIHRGYTFHQETCESMKRDFQKLELIEKEKESEIQSLQGSISFLYDTCVSAISEIEKWKDHLAGNALASGHSERRKSQIAIELWNSSTNDIPKLNVEGIRSIQDKLLLVVRDFIRMQNDFMEAGQSEMKSTILNLQRELQEKDVQRERVCTELVNQIKEAETNAKNCLHELQQVRMQLHNAQGRLNVMEEERKVLEERIKELQDQEIDSKDLQLKVKSLTDALATKVQETEALMQALDAQEAEMEDLTNKVTNLESELQQKNKDLENLETSRAKALKKLSVTVSKFDELHYFSESLLYEVEKLQSQLQERDAEISFLRQEVTRCTNDALTATELRKRGSDEIYDVLSWVDSLISRTQMHDMISDDARSQSVDEYKEALQKKILDLISEFENLRLGAQKSDILLQKERSKVEDLTQKEQYLKSSLHEKESQLVKLQEAGDSSRSMMPPSEIVEVEQMSNKWASSGTIAPQVRSLRKANNDQVAIAIDVDRTNDQLEDDDDKAHGFKSLTTSKFVPRFTRPVSDLVDGLWMSCDRALMRQPALRLGVILYWAVIHALLAAFVV